MRWLRAFLPAPQQQPAPLPRPEVPICVIGDLHGRLDLLDLMLARITAQPGHENARLVFVGDLIDRGPDSAGVLARVHALHRATPDRVICLMGNHERMMLDFLADPARHGPRWHAAGGAETLTSFGLSPYTRNPGPDLAMALRAALTDDVVAWLTRLPLIWQGGMLAVSHAGTDPVLSLDTQTERRLLWGPKQREQTMRPDGIWVAHGHTVVETANARSGQIAVDTGAWRSGRLSAAWLDDHGLSFIEVTGT